jgi:hypothetical protein
MRGNATQSASLNCYGKFTMGQGEKMCNIINTNNHLKNTLIPDITTSVQPEQDLMNFDVYPNPVNNKLFLTSLGEINAPFQIIISDLIGKTMLKRASVDSMEIIDVSDLSKGVYLLSILTAENKVFVKKIIVN